MKKYVLFKTLAPYLYVSFLSLVVWPMVLEGSSKKRVAVCIAGGIGFIITLIVNLILEDRYGEKPGKSGRIMSLFSSELRYGDGLEDGEDGQILIDRRGQNRKISIRDLLKAILLFIPMAIRNAVRRRRRRKY